MIRKLTKGEYYREKKIPQVTLCRRLEPEVPVRNHLIEGLPVLNAQFQKISSHKYNLNQTTLELANALKIIHELESQLELLTAKYTQSDQQLTLALNNNNELTRQLARAEENISSLQTSIQKCQFTARNKYESQKQQYYSIIEQLELKIDQMDHAYSKLQLDRQKQLQLLQQFHEDTQTKTNIHIQQLETNAETTLCNFKHEINKVNKENISMRNKITELETCNQEYLRELQKINQELSQSNANLKYQYQHKINTILTQLELAKNRITEQNEQILVKQTKTIKQTKIWEQERNGFDRKFAQNEQLWKNNYNSLIQQKEKTAQELHRKTFELGEKDQLCADLSDRVRRLEREVLEIGEQRVRNLDGHERAIKQLQESLQFDYQSKINEFISHYQTKLAKQIFNAIDNEKKQQEQKYRGQSVRLIENIRVLEEQKKQYISQLRLCEQERNQLQFSIDQTKIQTQYIKRANHEYIEQLKFSIENLTMENKHQAELQQRQHQNQLTKLKTQHTAQTEQIHHVHQQKLSEIHQAELAKMHHLRQLQARYKKTVEQQQSERVSFESRTQTQQEVIARLKCMNEQLAKQNRQIVERAQQQQLTIKKYQGMLQDDFNYKIKIEKDIQMGETICTNLRNQLQSQQSRYLQNIRQFQNKLFQFRKNQSMYQLSIGSLNKKLEEVEHRILFSQQQVRKLQNDKVQLQKKIVEGGVNSQQMWERIQADFVKLGERREEEAYGRQKQLIIVIAKKQQEVRCAVERVEQIEQILNRERSDLQYRTIQWQNKLRQLQEVNKKLTKDNLTISELQKQNQQISSNMKVMHREMEKYVREIQCREQKLGEFGNRMDDYETQVNYLKADKVVKMNEINQLENEITEIAKECELQKLKANREMEKVRTDRDNKIEEINRWKAQFELLQKKVEEEQEKQGRNCQQKRKISQRILQIQNEYELQSISTKQYKLKVTKQLNTLQTKNQQLQTRIKQITYLYQQQKTQQYTIIQNKYNQIKNLQKIVSVYQHALLQLRDKNQNNKFKYQSQKLQIQDLKQKYQKMQYEKNELQKNNKKLIEQIYKLQNQVQKTQKDILKIYEEHELRMELTRTELTQIFDKQQKYKTIQIQSIKSKLKTLSEEHRQQMKAREKKLGEEKNRLYQQLQEKNYCISELEIKIQQISREYTQLANQLSVYRKKWQKLLWEFNDNNEQLSQMNHRTQARKPRKIVKEFHEVKTERTERIIAGGNQRETPVSQQSGKNQEEEGIDGGHWPNVDVSAFNCQQNEHNEGTQKQQKNHPISDNTLGVGHSNTNSDTSIRMQSSSVVMSFSKNQ